MLTIEVNGKTIEAREGEMMLAAIKRAGIGVPTLCHMEGFLPSGACRMCVVELEGQERLIPCCAFPVADGMIIKTHSPRAVEARRTNVELLLANHPDDCLYCARNGTCELQSLAQNLNVRRRRFTARKSWIQHRDVSSPSLVRDTAKCILCGKCVRVCEEVQGVSAIEFLRRGSAAKIGTAFDEGMNASNCINCGQCILVCPTGALREQNHLEELRRALADPNTTVVVQHAPAISVTIGEEFGLKPGKDAAGVLVAAFRALGFKHVFDTSFSADLTVMEEASELVHRIKAGGRLPMMTSCSPGWIKYLEHNHPDFLPNLSTCKSPQQMMGALIKSHFAKLRGLAPEKIFSVSVMPCTAKKFEAQRPELGRAGRNDIDAVLTTRELATLIRMYGLDLNSLEPDTADTPFGERSTAGKLFGATGGVMEAALRTAHFLMTGTELPELKVEAVRGLKGVKTARVNVGGKELGVAVVSGLANASQLLREIREGKQAIAFLEVMTCPGGCIAGGGQPIKRDQDAILKRMRALYDIDRDGAVRVSHANKDVARLYAEFLGEPLGHASHELLHTHYTSRREE